MADPSPFSSNTLSFSLLTPSSTIKEGLYSPIDLSNVYYDLSANRQLYDFAQDGKLNPIPGSHEYVPSFDETRLADTSDLLAQENTTFALTLISGVSVLVLGFMILRQQTSPS